jgi:hypothetical protein
MKNILLRSPTFQKFKKTIESSEKGSSKEDTVRNEDSLFNHNQKNVVEPKPSTGGFFSNKMDLVKKKLSEKLEEVQDAANEKMDNLKSKVFSPKEEVKIDLKIYTKLGNIRSE